MSFWSQKKSILFNFSFWSKQLMFNELFLQSKEILIHITLLKRIFHCFEIRSSSICSWKILRKNFRHSQCIQKSRRWFVFIVLTSKRSRSWMNFKIIFITNTRKLKLQFVSLSSKLQLRYKTNIEIKCKKKSMNQHLTNWRKQKTIFFVETTSYNEIFVDSNFDLNAWKCTWWKNVKKIN